MIEITDRDIEKVEKLFFPEGGDFKDVKNERYDFIKCLDRSVDVHACPGSGKTTSLLAKLYLLSEKMPFDDGRAICVLTHTNVAIDTIKNRLGPKADSLFKYPNFFGTIQSFIDRYLAIPFFTKITGKKPQYIDTDLQTLRMQKTYWLGQKHREGLKGLMSFHYANGLYGNYTYISDDKEKYLLSSKSAKVIKLKKPRAKNDWSDKKKREIIEAGIRLKKLILYDQGIMSFDDAYWFANKYIQRTKNVEKLFSGRFKYLFIDEMQDTYPHQVKILNSIFDDTVITQRIGDLNQAILGGEFEETSWKRSADALKITGSKRVSQPIADILKCVALYPESDLVGFNRSNISRHIITYDNKDINVVIEKFIQLIDAKGLVKVSEDSGYPFKAVGWVGKEKDGLTIGSYFNHYNKVIKRERLNFPNLKTLLATSLEVNPSNFRERIFSAILEVLNLDGSKYEENGVKKRYTKSILINYLKKSDSYYYESLKEKISEWYLSRRTKNIKVLHEETSDYLKKYLFDTYDLPIRKKGNEFLDATDLIDIQIDEANASNIYYSENDDLKNIPVFVDTVHGVKGETHTATLYLETKYYRTCGEHLINQLIGNPYEGYGEAGNSNRDMCMKVAHVGFSRPTDLLCVAINRDLVKQHAKGLRDFGWEIL